LEELLLKPTRYEKSGDLRITGTSQRYSFDGVGGIPDQWQSFEPLIAQLVSDPAPNTYGVIHNSQEDGFDYLSGVDLQTEIEVPEGMISLTLPAQTYAVFWHPDHVATVRETCDAIWTEWLPSSGVTVVAAPWFEFYGEQFDPSTGCGGLEVWIPVRQ